MTARWCLRPWTARLTRAMGVLLSSRSRGGWVRCGVAGGSEAEHAADRPLVALGDVRFAAESARAHARLVLEQVGSVRLATPQAAAARHLDALGGASVRLHLRHYVIPLRLMRRLR